MDNLDAEYVLRRTDMTVTISRERFKDSPALPSLIYKAQQVDLGRVDRRSKPVRGLTEESIPDC
jgi:hypothetical protein